MRAVRAIRVVLERFEEKLVKGRREDCWEWMACKNSGGYGYFGFEGKVQLAHRVAYQLYVGEIPDGLCVCHKCDNPGCVRPDHLFLGTRADNTHDCENKGRGVHLGTPGENNGMSKLTEKEVRLIGLLSANGTRQADLAKEFGVTQPAISLIVCGRRWTKILEEEK